MTFNDDVLEVCSKVPKGKVTTYKEIANALGTSAYRGVGQALKRNEKPIMIPCHRVVKSDGYVGGYGGVEDSQKKIRLLREEGMIIENGKIKDMEKVKWP